MTPKKEKCSHPLNVVDFTKEDIEDYEDTFVKCRPCEQKFTIDNYIELKMQQSELKGFNEGMDEAIETIKYLKQDLNKKSKVTKSKNSNFYLNLFIDEFKSSLENLKRSG